MSNNLRQIAKDLRSFVKRCKDVHYSDSLLITFLVTGLLTTFAPSIIRADVAEDQQEVSAQAYDTITDLRQSFLRAKKENQKALRGANAELAQLLKQGDQVVKSPWASFQFGTGYTNNDWGTSYKGRGGKKLEYYSRTNDLTKYVFDASKHQYGATNLHISRNEEPNTLAINPANIHEPYSPYTVDQLSALSELAAPSFAPDLAAPGRVTYTPHFSHSVPAPSRGVLSNVRANEFRLDDPTYNNLGVTTQYTPVDTIATYENKSTGTTVTPGLDNAAVNSAAAAIAPTLTATAPTSATFLTANSVGYSEIYNTRKWTTNSNPITSTTAINNISNGTFYVGDADGTAPTKPNYLSPTTGGWWYNGGGAVTKIEYSNVTTNVTGSGYWGEDDTTAVTPASSTLVIGTSGVRVAATDVANVQKWLAIRWLAAHPDKNWSDATATTYYTSPTFHPGTPGTEYISYTDIDGTSRTMAWGGTQYTYYGFNHNNVEAAIHATTNADVKFNKFYFSGTPARIGLAVGGANYGNGSTVTSEGNQFRIYNDAHTGVAVFRTANNVGTFNDKDSIYEIRSSAGASTGIYNEGGVVNLTNPTFTVAKAGSNGIYNVKGAGVDGVLRTTGGTYTVSASANILTNKAYASINGGNFYVDAKAANAINSSKTLSVNNGTFRLRAQESNLITNTGDAHIYGNNGSFTLDSNAQESSAIYNAVATPNELTVSDQSFNIYSDKSNGINNKTGIASVSGNTFTVTGDQSNGITNAGELRIRGNNNNFTVSGSKSSGIYNTGKVTGQNVTFKLNSPGSKSNGLINNGTDLVSLTDSTFYVYQNESNGINNAKAGGTIKLLRTDFNVGDPATGGTTSGYKSNGIANLATLSTYEGTFTINGQNANGILDEKTATTETKYTNFIVSNKAYRSNAISTDGQLDTYGGDFTINAQQSNGIITQANASAITVNGSHFILNANNTNGIVNMDKTKSTTITVKDNPTDPNTAHRRSNFKTSGISRSNGIYTAGQGVLDVDKTDFDINYSGVTTGQYNNGIFIAENASSTAAAHTIKNSTFKVGSDDSNGIVFKSGASLGVTSSSFTTKGNYNNGILADTAGKDITIDGSSNFNVEAGSSHSNAIYAKQGKVSMTTGSITVNGTFNNGLFLESSKHGGAAGDEAAIDGVIFNVNTQPGLAYNSQGSFNNGIYVGSERKITSIKNSYFTLNDAVTAADLNGNIRRVNNNIGILVGDEADPSKAAEITTIESTTFNVSSTNANSTGDKGGTGIYMYHGTVNVGKDTTFVGDANDVFVTIRNYDHDNTLDLKSGSAMGELVTFKATGDNNIGINIQEGNSRSAHHTTLKIGAGGQPGWAVNFVGKDNVGIQNNQFANDFTIINQSAATPAAPGGGGAGSMRIDGERGIVFANLGYVHSGKLQLDGANVVGRHSAIAAFLNNNLNKTSIDREKSNTGMFRTDGGGYLKIQGTVGSTLATNANSNDPNDRSSVNSVGIYANTGQSTGTFSDVVALDPASTPTKALTFDGLNIGLGKHATNSTVLWADNGTHIDVKANSYTSNGGTGHISDGTMQTKNSVEFGYNINDEHASSDSVIAYATGYFDKHAHGYTTTSGPSDAGSKITFNSQVDMVSRRGTALLANNSGIIESKAVRAGGHESILAYVDGTIANNTLTRSAITIDGNILAADNNLLGVNNRGSYAQSSTGLIEDTYKNIGAVALNGGTVTIKNSKAATNVTEGTTGETEVDKSITKSLVYGMAAYAKGKGSNVIFDEGSSSRVAVVSGTDGALYATEKGQINFAGDIINQNNAGINATTKAGGATGISVSTRNARNVNGNDHTNVSPFYVNRTHEGDTTIDDAGIVFNSNLTNIDMYDGILLTGNRYNWHGTGQGYTLGSSYNVIRDYYKTATKPSGTEADKWDMAKYRGMENVTAKIMEDDYAVNLGIINQAKGIKWTDDGNTNTSGAAGNNYLGSIGKNYVGEMAINNAQTKMATKASATKVGNVFKSTLLNSELEVTAAKVDLEDVDKTDQSTLHSSVNDPFNDISMESTMVTIKNGTTVFGDIATGYRAGQGLNMANSLGRWDNENNLTSLWRKTRNTESGYINEGDINVWGGTDAGNVNIAGMNVVFGTATNAAGATIKVDHGYGIYATDTSLISNSGDITVTGKYVGDDTNTISTLRTSNHFTAEPNPSGSNYGIVGISDARANYDTTDDGQTHLNKIDIKHEIGKIKVEGNLAVGIYGENRNNALASDVKISYDDSKRSDESIDVSNPNMTGNDARGVGIALVNSTTNYLNGATNAGGVLTLNAHDSKFGLATNILTGKNGVGIYAESAEIKLNSPNFTVETKDNGVGLWAMDDTIIERRASHDKTFQYYYNGAKDKNGYAMAFGAKNPNTTRAENYLDITFSNKNDSAGVSLVTLNNKSNTGTSAGITGILVNTNSQNDVVYNKGDIKEDQTKSKTHLRSYGAVVNQGTFENWGDITLAESLMPTQASDVTRADMDKVNVGIRTNNLDRAKTKIVNHGDIKIGDTTSGKANTTSDKNIGSWAIYGTNIETGKKADGKNSQIVINRNSYGIYSGDGDVNIADTDIKVGNDTVLGHVQYHGKFSDGTPYSIDRQKDSGGNIRYSLDSELLSQLGRQRDSAIGVYIDNNQSLSNGNRNVTVNADMEIDRFSHGIVLAEKTGGATTTVNIGSAGKRPNIKLAYSTDNNAGGHVHSTKPTDTPEKIPHEVYEQGNAVYYYSADNTSRATTYANVTMDGDYNTAYFTKGSVINHGNIDLRSQYDVDKRATVDPTWEPVGYGSVGIISENTDKNFASINYGTITTGLSDTTNMMYSVGMGAGRNFYRTNNKNEVVYDRTEGQGYVVNEGVINVQEKAGIGMLATGRGSRAINKGTINLIGDNSIGMYIDREAVGENYGTIKGNAQNLKGVIAINGGFIKNYGTIDILGTGSTGIMTDSSKFVTDANGKPVFDANGNPTYITDETRPEYATAITAGQANGKTAANRGANDGTGTNDFYGTHNTDGVTTAVGSETSIEEGTSGNPKTTGVGTTIKMPNVVPLTQVTIDGVLTPITNIDTDARNIGDYANNITLRNSIQTGGTRIIDLSTRDEFGNRAWPRYRTNQTSEVTTIGMYVDTSGVRYTNPYNGIQNLTSLGRVNLYFGTEATMYTNAKAIRFGDIVHDDGTIEQSNILKPFNDALRLLPGGSVVNPLSAGLTWQTAAKINDNNQVTEVVMSKVPYHSFAFDSDKSLVNFTNNLDNLYEIARPGSEEKMIFNRLNSLGNGEGHILAQAFDQMRGHIYGGIQQRTNATSNLLTDELAQLRSENNASKDSNKIKAFGRREEYKTDTAGLPDWHSNAGGFVYLHEDETVKLGDRSGWYAGVVNNYFTFKDLARSYENQAMLKTGIFKQTPLDEDGTFTFTIGGDAFFGKTNTKRRFWVVDKEFRAKSDYYTYGADINAKLEKEFRLTEGFSIVPNVGLDLQYGRFSTVNEDGDMALKIKSDDYYSVKPRAGVDFRYSQPVFKKSNFVASVGLAYETELGRLNDVDNEAKIKGAWTDYYSIKGDKEDRKGNFKSDLKLGLDNGRLGFTVNTGYDTKGHNFRAGLGLRALF